MIGNHNNRRQLVSMQRKWQRHAISLSLPSIQSTYDVDDDDGKYRNDINGWCSFPYH